MLGFDPNNLIPWCSQPCVISVGDNLALAEQTTQKNHPNQSPSGASWADLEIASPYRGGCGTKALYIHPSSRTASSELAVKGSCCSSWEQLCVFLLNGTEANLSAFIWHLPCQFCFAFVATALKLNTFIKFSLAEISCAENCSAALNSCRIIYFVEKCLLQVYSLGCLRVCVCVKSVMGAGESCAFHPHCPFVVWDYSCLRQKFPKIPCLDSWRSWKSHFRRGVIIAWTFGSDHRLTFKSHLRKDISWLKSGFA